MMRKPHPSARASRAVRREIQRSQESNRALAARFGLNEKTIAKWKRRTSASDARMGPKKPVSRLLSPVDEALIVVFRKRTCLRLDDCYLRLKPIIPALSRSSLHRCLKRWGVSRLPQGLPEKLAPGEVNGSSAHFKIEIYALPGELAGAYLYVAINAVRYVHARMIHELTPFAAAEFLEDLMLTSPDGVSSVETNDHTAFVNSEKAPWNPRNPLRPHPFKTVCRSNYIAHFVVKAPNPTPRVVTKGWKGFPRDILARADAYIGGKSKDTAPG